MYTGVDGGGYVGGWGVVGGWGEGGVELEVGSTTGSNLPRISKCIQESMGVCMCGGGEWWGCVGCVCVCVCRVRSRVKDWQQLTQDF